MCQPLRSFMTACLEPSIRNALGPRRPLAVRWHFGPELYAKILKVARMNSTSFELIKRNTEYDIRYECNIIFYNMI